MKSKLFRRPTENGQRKTVLSCAARVMPTGAARSGGISSIKRFLATLGMTALLLFCPLVLPAQTGNGVTVEGLTVEPGSPTTVTFNVSWKSADMPPDFLWSDAVWVFVDYNNAGKMERLPLSGATLTSPSWAAASITLEDGNTSGAWVVGNAQSAGSFSATVQLLTATAVNSGACAYASNYPPVGKYTTATDIVFTGTSPYALVLEQEGGGTEIRESGSSFTEPPGYMMQSFTDKTGAPGVIHCFPPVAPTVVGASFCFGRPGQLQAVAPAGATIAWYDAPTAGNLLYAGNVLPLPALDSDAAQYYAEAVSERHCPSVRTQAGYMVDHCVINGSCPGFAAGNVGSSTAPAPEPACKSYDSGLIGLTNYQVACNVFYPGKIGVKSPPVACVSYDAGFIGRSQ